VVGLDRQAITVVPVSSRKCGAWRQWMMHQAVMMKQRAIGHLAPGGTRHPPGGLEAGNA